MISVTRGSGFVLTFTNGWAISVQFGANSYGDYYQHEPDRTPEQCFRNHVPFRSTTAEVAIIHDTGAWWDFNANAPGAAGCNVRPFQIADEIAVLVAFAAGLAPIRPQQETR